LSFYGFRLHVAYRGSLQSTVHFEVLCCKLFDWSSQYTLVDEAEEHKLNELENKL